MHTPALALGLPPGFRFKPEADEVVALYLLPRARGQAAGIAGVIIEDDATTAAVPPWELLARHGRAEDDAAYFFERIGGDELKDGARKDRRCGSSWTWVSQRRTPDAALRLPGGEEVSWNRRALNLHRGRGRSSSMGWVLHEYTITSPPCPCPVRLCHVAFTGHGRNRQRVPDGVAGKQAAAAAGSSSSSDASTTTFADQEPFLTCRGSSQETGQAPSAASMPVLLDPTQQQSQDMNFEAYCALLASDGGATTQEPSAGQPLTQEQLLQQQLSHLLGGLPANAETAAYQYHEEHVQMPAEQQQEPGTMAPMTDQGSPQPWDDIDAFCRVPEPGDSEDVPAGEYCWDWDGAVEQQGPV